MQGCYGICSSNKVCYICQTKRANYCDNSLNLDIPRPITLNAKPLKVSTKVRVTDRGKHNKCQDRHDSTHHLYPPPIYSTKSATNSATSASIPFNFGGASVRVDFLLLPPGNTGILLDSTFGVVLSGVGISRCFLVLFPASSNIFT